MRNEFSHRTLHGAPRARRRLLVATIVVLLVLLGDVLSGGALRATTRSAVSGMWRLGASVRGAIGGSGMLSTRASLASENAELRASLTSYQLKAAGYDVLRNENDTLRALLGLATTSRGVAAPIISSLRASPYGTFMLGAGSMEGVSAGDLVITEGGFVIATVQDVGEHSALAGFVLAPRAEIEAHVGGVAALVRGKGGGNAEAELPRAAVIAEGASVTAPKLGNRVVGVVGKIDSDPAKALQTAYVHVPVNMSSLRYVYIAHQ